MTAAAVVRVVAGTAGESADAALDRRLANWGRWARGEGGGTGRCCASAEGLYRSERVADEVRGWRSVDAGDAQVVEAAVTHLPEQERQVLVLTYVREFLPRRVCIAIGQRWTTPAAWGMRLRGARIALGLRLEGRTLLRDRGVAGGASAR